MEPVTLIVTALAAGASSALKETASKAIKDAYAGLKALIVKKVGTREVGLLESDPHSKARQGVVKEVLEGRNAVNDEEIIRQAQAMLEIIRRELPKTAEAFGVILEDVTATNLKVGNIESTGTGVKVARGEFRGDIEINGINAGKKASDPK